LSNQVNQLFIKLPIVTFKHRFQFLKLLPLIQPTF